MIKADGDAWFIAGPVTIDSFAQLLGDAEALGGMPASIDWSGAEEVDSSALALMFDWQRAAQAAGKRLRHVNLGASLTSLASLYGVTDLLAGA